MGYVALHGPTRTFAVGMPPNSSPAIFPASATGLDSSNVEKKKTFAHVLGNATQWCFAIGERTMKKQVTIRPFNNPTAAVLMHVRTAAHADPSNAAPSRMKSPHNLWHLTCEHSIT